jgi:glycosyltransferase involved in cell wall biosynthesis
MEGDVLVSVIIPVFNVQRYLREAIDSVLNQTYRKLEIIIVDDGSTDTSGDICDQYLRDKRVKVFHQENRGLGGARNTGLNNASGEYIVFLDSDDAFRLDAIYSMVKVLNRDNADIVISGYAICSTEEELDKAVKQQAIEYPEQKISSIEALHYLANGFFKHIVWDKLYKRKLWESIRFPENCVFEDTFVTYRILTKADWIITIPGTGVLYRSRQGSITQTMSQKNLKDWIKACKQWEGFIADNIPDLFTKEQMEYVQQKDLRGSIAHWALLTKEDRNSAKNICYEIIQSGEMLTTNAWSIRTRVAFFLIRNCAWILPGISKIYMLLRKWN